MLDLMKGEMQDGENINQKLESCLNIELILVKVNVEAQGLSIISIHHLYYTPFYELTVGKSNF